MRTTMYLAWKREKYGGIFVPPYRAVLHQYMREMMAGGGR